MGIVCLLAFGKCPWDWPPGDDDGAAGPNLEIEESCTWDSENLSFPINVWSGQAAIGEIAFDGNCDLIVGGGEELPHSEALYRVKSDGSTSVLVEVEQLRADSLMISGITHHPGDDRIYFVDQISDGPTVLYAVDDQDALHEILELDRPITSLTVAPESFEPFAGQLIAVQYAPVALLAIDVESQVVTSFATSSSPLSVATFGPDGTLYVAEWGEDRIATVTADGVFTTLYAGLDAPDGLAVSPDGTSIFVAHLQDGGRIDQISLADLTLTPGVPFELGTGFAPTGIVVDGANQVLYELPFDNHVAIGMFEAL